MVGKPEVIRVSQSVHDQPVSLKGFSPVHEKRGIEAEMSLTSALQSEKKLVDVAGIEPATPCLQRRERKSI